MTKKAILMMTFGSPEGYTFEDVAAFFTNIRRGVRPKDQEIQHLYDNYQLIGGSPLQGITREEVELSDKFYQTNMQYILQINSHPPSFQTLFVKWS